MSTVYRWTVRRLFGSGELIMSNYRWTVRRLFGSGELIMSTVDSEKTTDGQ